nr:hypothetical protein [Tanacetum cinerariifolium]
MFTTIGHIWTPTRWTFTLVGNVCPLTRITTTVIVSFRKPIPIESNTTKPVVTLVYLRKSKAAKKKVPVSNSKINKSLVSNKTEPNNSWGSIISNVPSSIIECRSNEDIKLEMAKLIKNNRILLNDNIFPHEEASMEVLLAKERILKLIQAWDDKQIKSWSLPALLLQFLNDSRTIDEMLKKREQAVNLVVQQKQEEHSALIFTLNLDFLMINDDEEHSIQYKEYLENSSNVIATVLPTEEPEYSLSIWDEHFSTILEAESNEVIKSSVKNHVQILSEYEVTSDDERDIQIFEELLSNDTPLIPENESSNFDHHDDPSFPHPPLEPPDVEIFFESDLGVWTTNVVKGISEHDFLMPNIFPTLPTFDLLYPVYDTLLLFSSENEDKVFKPGILSYLLVSHRDNATFDFSENPMMMYGGDIPLLDVLYLYFYPP